MLAYSHTPVQALTGSLFETAGVRVLVKREDLNHPLVSGNKWWKLKYNLLEARRQGKQTLLTFGGAFSNHLYATAAAAHELGFHSIGVVRGEPAHQLSPTLAFAKQQGMTLHFVSREDYRTKHEAGLIKHLHDQFGDFYLVAEGGTNEFAIQGVEEFARSLTETRFDFLTCAIGTGGTLAGLINGLPDKHILGFAALKGNFLEGEVRKWTTAASTSWSIVNDYHVGGYAKYTLELLAFIQQVEREHSLPLEHVYTAKMFYGLFDLVGKGFFPRGSTVLALHTGGLQGRLPALNQLTIS